MVRKNPTNRPKKNVEKAKTHINKIDKNFSEAQELLKQHEQKKASKKLKEVDRLIMELKKMGFSLDTQFLESVRKIRDVIEGKATIEEIFGVRLVKFELPKKYESYFELNEKKIQNFIEKKIQNKKYKTIQDIKETRSEIKKIVKEIAKTTSSKGFTARAQKWLYVALYLAIKDIKGKDIPKEMRLEVSQVFSQALTVIEGNGGGKQKKRGNKQGKPGGKQEKPGGEQAKSGGKRVKSENKEKTTKNKPTLDPLLILSERFYGKIFFEKLTEEEKEKLLLRRKVINPKDFLENMEQSELPQEVLDEINETLKYLGEKALIANPWQEALLDLFAVYVIKPVYKIVKENTDIKLVKDAVKKLLLYARKKIANIFRYPEESTKKIKEIIAMIRKVAKMSNDMGIQLELGSKFEKAANTVLYMAEEMEKSDGYLTAVMIRDPESVAKARMHGKYSIVRLKALTYLMFKLREEHEDNKALVIGIQFAIQIITRIYNDDELMKVSSTIRSTIKGLITRHGANLAEIPLTKGSQGAELDALLGIIFPDPLNLTSKEMEAKRNSINYRKIEKLLTIVEDLLAKDPKKYSKYNMVLICLIENIKEYLLHKNAEKQILKDWATLKGLIQKVSKEQGVEDPLLKLILKNPDLIEGTIAAFYKEPETPSPTENRGQLNRLSIIFQEIAKENKGNKKVVRGLELGSLVLDGFTDDKDFFTHIGEIGKIIDTVLFDQRLAGLKLSKEAKKTLKGVVGYSKINRGEPSEKVVKKIIKIVSSLEDLQSELPEEIQKKALELALKSPEIMKLNYAIAGIQLGIQDFITKKRGHTLGRKEKALIEYALNNYRNYLCDKYKNSTVNFLLDIKIGIPPTVSIKTKNIEKEAIILADIVTEIEKKTESSELTTWIERKMRSIGDIAKAGIETMSES